ncbi:FecR family protein [Niabella aquatica]
MERDIQYYTELLRKYTNDECSPEEMAVLMNFLSSNESNRLLLYEIHSRYYENEDKEKNRITVQQSNRIKKLLLDAVTAETKIRVVFWKRWWFHVAAAVVLICGGLYWFYPETDSVGQQTVKTEKAVLPGTEKASIKLSDGTTINLNTGSNEVLYNKNGVLISRTADGAIKYELSARTKNVEALHNTLTTPVGGECSVVLPDGSKLWLNARSSVEFQVAFAKKERRVTARGEVYFEVAKDAHRPFKVFSGGQSIEVLGTHFVVNTDADNTRIKTTLIEGRIRLSNGRVTKVLKPGQESYLTVNKDEIIVANKQNPETAAAWKDGYFVFDNTDFKTVEEQISKWYDVEFVYDRLPDNLFYGKVERKKTLDKVLQMLEIVGNIHFKTEGRKIYLIE